jgi:hypothetical protein
MSLFNWLLSKKLRRTPAELSARPVATQPPSTGSGSGTGSPNKGHRTERREKLYTVIREAMLHTGMLPSSYKFKVLSLDSRARRFMVMIDLAHEHGDNQSRQSQIEKRIMEMARARDKITVMSVYWRLSASVSAMQPVGHHNAWRPSSPMPLTDSRPMAFVQSQPVPTADPVDPQEVEAFRSAFQKAAATAPQVAPPKPVKPAPTYTLLTGFEETEMPEEGNQALSGTQYGALN